MDFPKIHRRMVSVGGVELLCRDTEGAGPPILCLHGRWGRGETWSDFIRRYSGSHRVIAPDQRGHGLSARPIGRYDSEELAADMAGLLEALGIGEAIVVGHSMGGAVAGHLAASRPDLVRALAILDKSAAGPREPESRPPEELSPLDPLTKDWPLPFGSLLEAREFIRGAMDTEPSREYFMASLVESAEGYGLLFSPRAVAANMAYYRDWFEVLARITRPAMLLRSRGSGAVSDGDWERMKAALPGCRAYELEDPDHNVHLADREGFYRCFEDFLGGL